MRVLTSDGHSIDGVQATLRIFFRLLDIFPVVPFSAIFQTEEPINVGLPSCLFGLVMMTFSKKFQRVGDLVAGTVVVNEDSSRAPGLIVFTDSRVPMLAEMIPASFVATPGMSKAIANYADQRRFLHHQRASEIAGYIAAPLLDQFGLLADTDHDLFLCALYYKTFVATENGMDDRGDDEPEIVTPGGQAIPQASPDLQLPVAGPGLADVAIDQNVSPLPVNELPVAIVAEETS